MRNTYGFQLLDARDLDRQWRWITGSVTSAKLTEGWRSDYRSSLSLGLDSAGGSLISGDMQGMAVRVYRYADGEPEVMGTFITDGLDRDLGLERWTGTVSMYSLLMKEGTDLRRGDRWIPAGTDFRSHFESVVEGSGGTARVDDAISGSFGCGHIWEAGKSALSELQAIAEACNGYVGVDAMGNVTLTPYQLPADRPYSWSIDARRSDVTAAITEKLPDVTNRVVCHHESGDLSAGVVCSLDDIMPSHRWCRSRIGRWATEDYSVPAIPDWVTTNDQLSSYLHQQAEQRLREKAGAATSYGVEMLYDPRMKPGTRGGLYLDTGTEGTYASVYVTQREIALDASMKMQLTLEVCA